MVTISKLLKRDMEVDHEKPRKASRRHEIPVSSVLKTLRRPHFLSNSSRMSSRSPTGSISSMSWSSEESLNEAGNPVQERKAPCIGLKPQERLRRIREMFPKQKASNEAFERQQQYVRSPPPARCSTPCYQPAEVDFQPISSMGTPTSIRSTSLRLELFRSACNLTTSDDSMEVQSTYNQEAISPQNSVKKCYESAISKSRLNPYSRPFIPRGSYYQQREETSQWIPVETLKPLRRPHSSRFHL